MHTLRLRILDVTLHSRAIDQMGEKSPKKAEFKSPQQGTSM